MPRNSIINAISLPILLAVSSFIVFFIAFYLSDYKWLILPFLAMYLSDIYTVSANLAGIPGISVPCGLSSENLPIGLQLVGKTWSEALLLNLAHVYENAFPLNAKPQIFAE